MPGSCGAPPDAPLDVALPPYLALDLNEPCHPDAPCGGGGGLGELLLSDLGVREAIHGSTLSGLETTGEQTLYEVTGPEDVRLVLASVEWCFGEREVRRTRRFETPWRIDRVLGRQRLPIEPWGDGHFQIELDQAKFDEGESEVHPHLVDQAELDRGAGTCVRCALLRAGALAYGTRQEVLGVSDDRRHHLCATFPRSAIRVPVVAFVLTRVAPLLLDIRSSHA